VTGDAIEITELTIRDADVRGIHVAIDLPGYFAMWHLLFAQFIGDVDQIGQGGMMIQMQPLFKREEFEPGGFTIKICEIHEAKVVER
jgi:hypothetical protein